MSKFKVGDKVKYIGSKIYSFDGIYTNEAKNGDIFEISSVKDDVYSVKGSYKELDPTWYYMEEEFELINSNKTINNMLEKFKIMLKGEPQKSFCKAGITDINYNLTEEGNEIFSQWLLKKFGDDFKLEVVDELLKEVK